MTTPATIASQAAELADCQAGINARDQSLHHCGNRIAELEAELAAREAEVCAANEVITAIHKRLRDSEVGHATADAALKAAREALSEAEETLRLVERPAFPDPVHHERVKALGREIGFGAMMSTASAGWREIIAEKNYPLGGEFVAGPCYGTVIAALKKIRAALTPLPKES